MVTRLVLASIVILTMTFASAVHADESFRFESESTGDAKTCAGSDVLRARIAERLGRDPFTSDAKDARRLHVTFAKDSRKNAWTAEVALFDRDGARSGARSLTHTGSTCEPLVGSVVLTIAVLLEELAPRTEPKPAPLPEPEPAPDAPPSPPPVAPDATRNVRFDVAAAGTTAVGLAPATAIGAEGTIGVDIARARLELTGRTFFPVSSEGDVAVRTRLVLARVAPCYGRPVFSACILLAVGSLSGEATGARVASSQTDGRLYAAAGAGVLSRIFVYDDLLFVRLSVDVLAALSRTDFDVGTQRVWSLPVASGSASIGIGARIP